MPGICIGPQYTARLQEKTMIQRSTEETMGEHISPEFVCSHVALNAANSQKPKLFSFEANYG